MKNPPAFPIITPDMPVDGSPGMTLRDYLAAKAMQGIVANAHIAKCLGDLKSTMSQEAQVMLDTEVMPGVTAKAAYALADAMLAEREKAQP